MSSDHTPQPAPELPEAADTTAPSGRAIPEGDTPMRTNAAERLIIEEPTLQGHDEGDDDFNILAVATKAAQLADPTASQLAHLFHHARLSATYVEGAAQSAQAEAVAFYPPPPAEILSPDGRRERPAADWPAWKRSAYALWERQRELIDRGLGVDEAEEAAVKANQLRDNLGKRALATPARSLEDVREKLSVVSWMLGLDSIEVEETRHALDQLSAEFGVLLKPGHTAHA